MAEPTNESIVRMSVSLYPEQASTLMQVARDSGLENVSAALRLIINDWKRMRSVPMGLAVESAPAESLAEVAA